MFLKIFLRKLRKFYENSGFKALKIRTSNFHCQNAIAYLCKLIT